MPAEEMPLTLRRRIASLEALHAKFETLEEEHHERLRQIEQSFTEQTEALFERRQRIVSGLEEPTDAEVQESVYYEELASGADEANGADDEPKIVGVPSFWPTVLRHCPSLQDGAIDGFAFSDADREILEHLVEVRSEPWNFEDDEMPDDFEELLSEPGYSLVFRFAPNPMMESESIALYCLGTGEVVQANPPLWSDRRHDPTLTWVSKKVKKKGAGSSVKRVSARPAESFFRIFSPADEDAAAAEERAALLPLTELQEEIVLRLREDAIPRASMYYISALLGDDFGEEDFDE